MRVFSSVFIFVSMVAVISADPWHYGDYHGHYGCGCPPPHRHIQQYAASGWNDQWAEKTHTCLDGTIGTRGAGGAKVQANNQGVNTWAKATCGAYSKNNFNKNKDSWGRTDAWKKDSYGNSKQWSDNWQNNVDSRASNNAAGAGRTKLNTVTTQDNTEANVKASRGTWTNANLQRDADQWRRQNARRQNADGDFVEWNNDWADKKRSNNRVKGRTWGYGSNQATTDEDGSDVKVRGSCGAKGKTAHKVKRKGWSAKNENGQVGNKTWNWNKNYGVDEKSKGFVKSRGYGKTKIDASSDANDGANLDAWASRGTRNKFDYHQDQDNWGDNNATKKRTWVDTVYPKPCDHHHHHHGHHHHHEDRAYPVDVNVEAPAQEVQEEQAPVVEEAVAEEEAQEEAPAQEERGDWWNADWKGDDWKWGCGCPHSHGHYHDHGHYHGHGYHDHGYGHTHYVGEEGPQQDE